MNLLVMPTMITAQKVKLSVKDFFSECDYIRSFLQIWSHLLKKSLIENFIFVQLRLLTHTQKLPISLTNSHQAAE